MAINPLKKYIAIFLLSMKYGFKNYKVLCGLSLFLITCLMIFAHLWSVTSTKASMSVYSTTQLLWYIALNEWILVSLPDMQFRIEEEIKTGALAYHLPRPISYFGAKIAEGFGLGIANFLFLGATTFAFTIFWTGNYPFTYSSTIVVVVASLLSLVLGIMLQLIVGLSSFWLEDVAPFHWVLEKFLFVLGGLIMPLSAYPPLLEKIALCTPFSAVLGLRSSLAMTQDAAGLIMIVTSFWILLALFISRVLARKGLERLNLSGG